MSRNQKCRPWRPGEREAIEQNGVVLGFMQIQRGRVGFVKPAIKLSVGAQVEADDAADLVRTMPEAFGRGS